MMNYDYEYFNTLCLFWALEESPQLGWYRFAAPAAPVTTIVFWTSTPL